MKDKIPIEKTKLPYHVERGFFDALKHSAEMHGYTGFVGRYVFLATRLFDYTLGLIARFIPFSGIKVKLHRMRGVKIGKDVHIGPLVMIDDIFQNFVIIEDGVSLAGSNIVLSHSRPLKYFEKHFESFVAPVRIKKNAWIAIGAIILPGDRKSVV